MAKRLTKREKAEQKRELLHYIGAMRATFIAGLRKRIPMKENGYAQCLKDIENAMNFMEEELRKELDGQWL